MKAILADRPGGAEQLHFSDIPRPDCGQSDILVRVEATALNRADLLQREGKYPPPPGASEVFGLEMAGRVVAIGEEVTGWVEGDRVCALLPGGGYAEYVAVPEFLAMRIPENLSFEEAAAIPEAFVTAFQALEWLGAIAPSSHVLIHAGSSGVGTAAIQLARARDAHPMVTCSEGKRQACLALGAELAIDYRTDDPI